MSSRGELGSLVRLAVPIILSDLGWMSMWLIDTMMVGRIRTGTAVAIGAVSIGGIFFAMVSMVGGGVMMGLDPLVSHARGAGRPEEGHRWLVAALYVMAGMAPLLMGTVWLCVPLFRVYGYEAALLEEIARFLHALVWSMPPLLAYFALRRYLQATSRTRPVVFALVTANLVNLAGNWVLIYGNLGAPAMGVAGSAWSTVAARVYMVGILAAYALYEDWPWRIPLRPDFSRMRKLLGLGLPAAGQITFEIGVFATAGAFLGKLGGVPLAAHQVTMSMITATYMAPLGINAASAVRVGEALGRGDRAAAARAGWMGIGLGAAFMCCCCAAVWLFPRAIGRAITNDRVVVEAAVPLLAVGAVFQIFDGLQTCAMGALRGAGDTRTAMLWHMIGYWAVGLPLGYALCFAAGWGALGMWDGLCVAVAAIGVGLVWAWARKTRAISPAA